MDSLTIESNDSLTLTFHSGQYGPDGWLECYDVDIQHGSFRASVVVANPHYGDDPTGLFEDLAKHWSGWSGAKEWRSIQSELQILATCNSRGHVQLEVRIPSEDFGGWIEWSARVKVRLEAGQLERLARDVTAFFARR